MKRAPGWLFDLVVDVLPLAGFGVGLSFLEDVVWKEAIVSFAAVMAYFDAARLRRRVDRLERSAGRRGGS